MYSCLSPVLICYVQLFVSCTDLLCTAVCLLYWSVMYSCLSPVLICYVQLFVSCTDLIIMYSNDTFHDHSDPVISCSGRSLSWPNSANSTFSGYTCRIAVWDSSWFTWPLCLSIMSGQFVPWAIWSCGGDHLGFPRKPCSPVKKKGRDSDVLHVHTTWTLWKALCAMLCICIFVASTPCAPSLHACVLFCHLNVAL